LSKTISTKFCKIISSQHRGEKIYLTTLRYLKLINKSVGPQTLVKKTLEILRPGIKIISHVKAGKIIYLPAYQTKNSAQFYALKWLCNAARERAIRTFKSKYLALEIKDTLKNRGRAFKSKLDLIKLIRESRMNLRKKFYKAKTQLLIVERFWNPRLRKFKYNSRLNKNPKQKKNPKNIRNFKKQLKKKKKLNNLKKSKKLKNFNNILISAFFLVILFYGISDFDKTKKEKKIKNQIAEKLRQSLVDYDIINSNKRILKIQPNFSKNVTANEFMKWYLQIYGDDHLDAQILHQILHPICQCTNQEFENYLPNVEASGKLNFMLKGFKFLDLQIKKELKNLILPDEIYTSFLKNTYITKFDMLKNYLKKSKKK